MYRQNENIFSDAKWDAFLRESGEIKLESDNIKVENTPVADLDKSYQFLIRLNIDQSDSMKKFSDEMNLIIETIKAVILSCVDFFQFQISKTIFASSVKPEAYMNLQKFNFSLDYSDNTNSTKLYDSIIDSERRCNKYAIELMDNGIRVNSIVFILSDGNDNGSKACLQEAKESIKRLQDDYIVIFVNFGGEQGRELANMLNIGIVINPDITMHELYVHMGFVDRGVIKKSQGNK